MYQDQVSGERLQDHWSSGFHFWWQNWLEFGIYAYCNSWCVPTTVRVDAKSENASESQNLVKGQMGAK